MFLLIANGAFSPARIEGSENESIVGNRTSQQSDSDSEKLTGKLNSFIEQKWNEEAIRPAENCNDSTFARRVYLDLAGRAASTTELKTFVADGREDKRARLIDLLLESEDHAIHFADLFDALLMGRAAEHQYAQRVKHGWRAYLEDVFRSNRPWDSVAREILLARPTDESRAGAVWFLYERNNQHQAIAEAVAPAFFGIRIECAQCHDHMMADEITQAHYWGLVAFFNRGKNELTSKGPRVVESAIGGFSEFADLSGDSSPNLLTFLGAGTVDEKRPEKDAKQEDAEDLYLPSAVDGEPRLPKFSRREKFVSEIVDQHPLVAKAMVNRIWAAMLGRGLVHPFDEMDSMHDPSHPELLTWLTEDFRQSGYDVRRLIRAIANSRAYQLSSVRPVGVDDPSFFAWYIERPLTAEQMARSIQLLARGSFQNDSPLVGLFRQQLRDVLPDETVVTIDDALFLSNNRTLHEFLDQSDASGHFVSKLLSIDSTSERARVMIESAFGRQAAEDETLALTEFLDARQSSPQQALTLAFWSLINSAEYRLNH